MGLSHFFHPQKWADLFHDAGKNPHFPLYAGIFNLTLGLPLIIVHNLWILKFSLFLTIAGWIMTLKSISYLLYPRIATKVLEKNEKKAPRNFRIVGIVATIFGGIICMENIILFLRS